MKDTIEQLLTKWEPEDVISFVVNLSDEIDTDYLNSKLVNYEMNRKDEY